MAFIIDHALAVKEGLIYCNDEIGHKYVGLRPRLEFCPICGKRLPRKSVFHVSSLGFLVSVIRAMHMRNREKRSRDMCKAA